MADRTRSSNHRSIPQHPSIVAPQHPPRRSTRSTRSRSHDISGAERPKSGPKERKTAARTVANVVELPTNRGIQGTGNRDRNARSKPVEDLPAVQEDAGVKYPDLAQNATEVAGPILQSSRANPRQNDEEQNPSGDLSAFSGSTARPSVSGQDLAYFIPETAATYDEALLKDKNSQQAGPAFHQSVELSRTSTRQTGASSHATEINFNSPKNLTMVLTHLEQRKAGRATKKPTTKNTAATITGSSVHGVTLNKRDNQALKPSSASGRLASTKLDPPETEDIWRLIVDDEEEERPLMHQEQNFEPDVVAKGRQVLEHKAQCEAENDKENLMENPFSEHQPSSGQPIRGAKKLNIMDRQPNAKRVSPLESQESNPPHEQNNGRYHASVSDEHEEIDDPSSDSEFETDTRKNNVDSRRNNKSAGKRFATEPVATSRLHKKARTEDNPTKDENGATACQSQGKAPAPSQFESYKIANAHAKTITAQQPKRVQSRKAWTEEETERLINLIEEHGTSWKLLKEKDKNKGSVLKHRDQVGLKDKARNMKVDFLKAGPYMPENFENIALNKGQTDKLRSLGIEYSSATGRLDDDEADADGSDEE